MVNNAPVTNWSGVTIQVAPYESPNNKKTIRPDETVNIDLGDSTYTSSIYLCDETGAQFLTQDAKYVCGGTIVAGRTNYIITGTTNSYPYYASGNQQFAISRYSSWNGLYTIQNGVTAPAKESDFGTTTVDILAIYLPNTKVILSAPVTNWSGVTVQVATYTSPNNKKTIKPDETVKIDLGDSTYDNIYLYDEKGAQFRTPDGISTCDGSIDTGRANYIITGTSIAYDYGKGPTQSDISSKYGWSELYTVQNGVTAPAKESDFGIPNADVSAIYLPNIQMITPPVVDPVRLIAPVTNWSGVTIQVALKTDPYNKITIKPDEKVDIDIGNLTYSDIFLYDEQDHEFLKSDGKSTCIGSIAPGQLNYIIAGTSITYPYTSSDQFTISKDYSWSGLYTVQNGVTAPAKESDFGIPNADVSAIYLPNPKAVEVVIDDPHVDTTVSPEDTSYWWILIAVLIVVIVVIVATVIVVYKKYRQTHD
jgi:hypothetical protein